MKAANTIKKSSLAPTILISGGAGFIGSHLAEVLLQKEARVIVLDNFKTGKEIHVKHLVNNPKFALYDVDINVALPSEIESVDYIFHLAGLEEYLYSKRDMDLDSLLTNAFGTKNLLDLAQKSNAKFMLASTIDVYEGRMSQLDISTYFGKSSVEEKKYSLTEAKRYAEALVWEYHKKNSTDVRIVRLPEIFGPRMSLDASGYLGKTLKDLIEGRPFIIKGDGAQKEHYLYITDAVSGMIKALLNEGTVGQIYSLVPPEPISYLETAYLVRSLADRHVEISFVDEDSSEPPVVKFAHPDTYNHIYLKWNQKVLFKDGIILTLQGFGYQINQHAFKNSKFLDKKQNYDWLNVPSVAPTQVQEDTNVTSYNTPTKVKKVKFKFPKKNVANQRIDAFSGKPFRMPSIKFPSKLLPKISFSSKFSVFFVVLVSFLLVFIVLPAFQTYKSAKKAMTAIQQVPDAISSLNIDLAKDSSREAFEAFKDANKSFASLDWVFKLAGRQDQYKATAKFLSSVTYFSRVAYDVTLTVEPLGTIWETIKPDSIKTFDPAVLDISKLHISDAKSNLQLALADFNSVDVSELPPQISDNVNDYADVLKEMTQSLDISSAVITELPDLLGFDSPKKYIILFQNNNEIRPTGGFIGSYAYLYLRDGKIEELNIDDIYNPDGQIDVRNIRVSPPKPIGDHLVEDRLYIRNANWDPDFERSAAAIKDLFFKLNGDEIDGAIAVDLNFVSDLLRVTGPLFLTAYNEEISADNLYERTNFHAAYNYEEGSQSKRQFLTVLGQKLLESLFALENTKLPGLVNVVTTSLTERHFLVHLFANSLNANFMSNGWTGSLLKTDGDYLQVVNANLGGTKANYYVNEEMAYRLSSKTRDGLLRAELILDYTHTGIDDSWPGGPYINYLRVLTQKGTKLTGAKVIYDATVEEDIFDSIIISHVEPYNSFETSFELEPSSSIKVVFYYDLPIDLSITKSQSSYSLLWQKQAGTDNDRYAFSLGVPFGMSYVNISDNLKYTENTIFSSGILNQDLTLYTELE